MHCLFYHALSARETLISVQKQHAGKTVAVVEVPAMQNLRDQQLEDELVGMVLRAKEKDIKPSERDLKSESSSSEAPPNLESSPSKRRVLVSEIYQPSRR